MCDTFPLKCLVGSPDCNLEHARLLAPGHALWYRGNMRKFSWQVTLKIEKLNINKSEDRPVFILKLKYFIQIHLDATQAAAASIRLV